MARLRGYDRIYLIIIDDFLQDVAQVTGTITYSDISRKVADYLKNKIKR